MNAHTPTPWEIKKANIDGANYELWSPIGRKSGYIYTDDDAKFVTEACNAYDASQKTVAELAAALEKIRDKAKSWEGRSSDVPYWNLGDIAAAVLKKVKGK